MQNQVENIKRLIERREFKKAEVALAKLFKSNPPQSIAEVCTILRARLRLLSDRPDEAIRDLNPLVEAIGPEYVHSAEILELLGDSHLSQFELSQVGFADQSDVRSAHAFYQRLITEFPGYANSGWINYQIGRVYLILDHVHTAENYFHEALFSPSHIWALTAYCFERLGFIAYYESRQRSQALVFLDKAVHTYPDEESRLWLIQVYILRSRILRDMDLKQSLQSAKLALAIAKQKAGNMKSLVAEVLFSIAEIIHEKPGFEPELIDYLKQYFRYSRTPLGVDVTWSRAYEMLGNTYFVQSDYENAINAYDNSLRFNPDHPWEETIYFRMAYSQYHKQDYNGAIQTIKKMIANIHTDGQSVRDYRIYGVLGNSFFALGRYSEAIVAYQTAFSIAPPGLDLQDLQTYYTYALRMDQPL